jgi:MoaA/NifB/PqqE/SkfB family radical SAM enzyme
LLHGHFEGRNPGPSFSTSDYLEQNPDVATAGMNALLHYELHGRNEGRRISDDQSATINDDKAVLERAKTILMQAIELGKSGRFTVSPSYFSISATSNCNLACTMCMGHSGMTGPTLSLDQAESIFGTLNSDSTNSGRPVNFDVTAGEPTLNRELHLIFRMFKERFPSANVSIISNATLPVKGRVRNLFEYADSIAVSMDGATRETYERIRRGSRFDNVIRNVRDIAQLKNGSVKMIFVAMDENIHEMPLMAKLCADLGVRELFIQAVAILPSFWRGIISI